MCEREANLHADRGGRERYDLLVAEVAVSGVDQRDEPVVERRLGDLPCEPRLLIGKLGRLRIDRSDRDPPAAAGEPIQQIPQLVVVCGRGQDRRFADVQVAGAGPVEQRQDQFAALPSPLDSGFGEIDRAARVVGRLADPRDHGALDVPEGELVEVVAGDGAILYSAEKATWMAGEAIQALGGNGYINEYPAGRLWRDAKLYEIGAGTSEIRRMLIGRELFAETK